MTLQTSGQISLLNIWQEASDSAISNGSIASSISISWMLGRLDTATTEIKFSDYYGATRFNQEVTASASSVNEGSNITFTFKDYPGQSRLWQINHGTTTSSDFSGTQSGNYTSNSTTGEDQVTLTTVADVTTEGAETFSVSFGINFFGFSASATSPTITINDTSTAPVVTEEPYYELFLLRTLSGQSNPWTSYTDSVSSYTGQAGRLVFAYQNGLSSTSYRGDIQIDNITASGTTYSFESTSQDWKTSIVSQGTGGAVDITTPTLRNFEDGLPNYITVPTATTAYRWNRDSGGTPSSSTGQSSAANGSYYLYAETSGTSTNGMYYTTCSPFISSLSGSTVNYAVARYGSNIGTLKVYWAKNVATDPYPAPFSFTNIQRLSQSTGPGGGTTWVSGNQGTSVYASYGPYPSAMPSGSTARVVIVYRTGNSFTGDLQFDDFFYGATTATSGGVNANIDVAGTWEQSSTLRTYTSSSYPSDSVILNAVNGGDAWQSVTSGTTAGLWNIDSAGTPSGSTGISTVGSGNYIYYESSTPGYSYKVRLLRSPEFTASKPQSNYGIRTKLAAYGATIGFCAIFLVWG